MPKTIKFELRALYAAWTVYPDRCAICWIPSRRLDLRLNGYLELAHVISRARGGEAANGVGNVLFLCSSCHGSQHQYGYTYNGTRWPNIELGHLLKAKLELGELSVHDTAEISGYTARYILELTQVSWPAEIVSERLKWQGAKSRTSE